ncbi:MAG: hypothetical protein Kow00109_15760 [Acidobacteriota bacterium]
MLRVFCDFDGTITERDTIVFLTERFGAGPEFRRAVLERITRGEISVFEAVRLELETVRVDWNTAVETLRREVRVDPYFEPFVRWAREQGITPEIVSSGMRPIVELYVGHLGLPIYAHEVTPSPGGWRYAKVEAADKQRILEQACGRGFVVYVGDGASDVSVADLVDLLLAKRGRYLERWCRERNRSFISYADFRDVQAAVAAILEKERISLPSSN